MNSLTGEERQRYKELNDQLLPQGKHQCSRCLEILPLKEFSPYGKKSPGKPYSQCKFCVRNRVNKVCLEKTQERQKTYQQTCALCDVPISANRETQAFCCKPHRLFAWTVKGYQGSIEDARRLFALTACEVCGQTERLCIDHSHNTGRLRGRICSNCNSGLGHFFDSIETMKRTIRYLGQDYPIIEDLVLDQGTRGECCLWCENPIEVKHFNRIYCSVKCKVRAGNIRGKFKLSVAQYKHILSDQKGQCPCCGSSLDSCIAAVDHDHTTQAIRGILCLHCNLAIGQCQDDVVRIQGLIEYLLRHRRTFDEWSIEPIDHRKAREIAVEKHYLHRPPNVSYSFGLMYQREIKGICTFGTPPSMRITHSVCPEDPKVILELNRLWIDNSSPKFAASWFVSRCLDELPPRIIISYADTGIHDDHHDRQHDGTIYKALSFHFAGTSKASKDWRIPGTTRNVGRNVPGTVCYDVPPKNRFWTVTGDRRDKKRLRDLCQWPKMDYPITEQTKQNP